MPKKLIIANWKMNPDSMGRAVRLAKEIERGTRGVKNVSLAIAPPYPFLESVGKALKKTKLGAQNIFWEDARPYTGEVSGRQLKHLGITYVIIGHSERRIYFGETDVMINKKVRAALKAGLRPVLAVGERKKMPNKKMRGVLSRQLIKNLEGVSVKSFRKGVIAYEPVWAIGTGRAATPKHAKYALGMIQEILAHFWKVKKVSTPILYGGSVNARNAAAFISKNGGGMDGMLVGSASLKPKDFIEIVRSSAVKR